MAREGKGKDVTHYIKDYCVFDLETTGTFINKDKIIEISALKVRNEEVVDEFSTLVNPQMPIPSDATDINHITDDMVKDAPILEEIIDKFIDFVGDDVLIGYNNKSFDVNMVYDAYMELRGKRFMNDFIDVLYSARSCLDFLERHSLESICDYFQINTTGAHRALQDCYLTKAVYEKLNEKYGEAAFYRASSNSNGYGARISKETEALRELQTILSEMVKVGDISYDQIFFLQNWMSLHEEYKNNYPFNTIFKTLERVMEDNVITLEEKFELQQLFRKSLDPVSSMTDENAESIKDKHVCITGDFECGTREEVFKMIEEAGGIVDKGTKKTTDYVVMGSLGSDTWKAGNYGSKVLKAMEYNEKGCDIKIIKEDRFVSMIASDRNKRYEIEDRDEYEGDMTWQERISALLDEMVKEHELPENSLYLKINYKKEDATKITSYNVAIWEPDYPPKTRVIVSKNDSAMIIYDKADTLNIVVGLTQFGDCKKPKHAEIKELKSDLDAGCIRLIFDKNSLELIDFVREHVLYTLARYVSKASRFGCCSKFEECSDAKKCVHENKLYSKACMYRSHLDAGRIFYGKNKNYFPDQKRETREEQEKAEIDEVNEKHSEKTILPKGTFESYSFNIDEESISFDTDTVFKGEEKPTDNEKLIRKILGLPITKQLIYYKDIKDAKSVRNIKRYRIVKLYEITDRWATIEIELDDGEKVLINSMFLIDMQKPSFIDDMKNDTNNSRE